MGIGIYSAANRSQRPLGAIGIGAAVERIRSDTGLAALTAEARRIREADGADAYRTFKSATLPCVTWAGNFPNARNADAPMTPSGLVFVESDHLADAAAERQRLSAFPIVAAAYISTGGDGVHCAARVSPIPKTAADYKAAWDSARAALGLVELADSKASDISRLAFLAYDPDCYANPKARPLAWEYPTAPTADAAAAYIGADGAAGDLPHRGNSQGARAPFPPNGGADWLESALAHIPSDDYEVWYKVGMAIKADGRADGFALWDKWSATSGKYGGADKTRKQWDAFKRSGLTLGTVWLWAKERGWNPNTDKDLCRCGREYYDPRKWQTCYLCGREQSGRRNPNGAAVKGGELRFCESCHAFLYADGGHEWDACGGVERELTPSERLLAKRREQRERTANDGENQNGAESESVGAGIAHGGADDARHGERTTDAGGELDSGLAAGGDWQAAAHSSGTSGDSAGGEGAAGGGFVSRWHCLEHGRRGLGAWACADCESDTGGGRLTDAQIKRAAH